MGKDTQSKKTRNPAVLREFSAGGVVFKKDKWLIRSTTPSEEFPKSYWMLPKGWIDDGEKIQETALREVREEGGVNAKIIKKIGTINYPFKHPTRGIILKFVTFYLMEYESDVDGGHDWETAEVKLLPFDEAYKKLSFSGEKQMLAKARELLNQTY